MSAASRKIRDAGDTDRGEECKSAETFNAQLPTLNVQVRMPIAGGVRH
jgi:hypothetical protein